MTIFETDWRAVLNTIQFQILGLIVSGQNIVVSVADKTDHLEWEVFDAGLTILNGKSLVLDYYILVGLLKYRFWISDTSIFWLSLIMIYA